MYNSSSAKMTEKTAGIVIIGDEILKGQIVDTNSQKICQKFYELGFKVKQTVIIPDQVEVIAQKVASFASMYDYVVTSGGVGPTHDDMTYDGVAKAFGEKLTQHPVLVKLLEKYFGSDHSHPAFKMSEVPESASILWNEDRKGSFPMVNVKNVYILPGIPSFMERCLQCLFETLQPSAMPAPNTMSIYVDSDEVSITGTLNDVVSIHSKVSFGSYPTVSNSYYKVQITLESDSESLLQDAHSYLLDRLPKDKVVNYVPDPVTGAAQTLTRFLEANDFKKSLASMRGNLSYSYRTILEDKCFTEYRYTPLQLCISFNGGKDCTALLHMYHCALKNKFPDWKQPIKALYIQCEDPFPEVEAFIKETTQRYNLNLQTVQGPIKQALDKFLASNPEIKGILMGNRKSDPYSRDLNCFQMTDKDWPQAMRVFPLLSWDYAEIWQFLRHFFIPYCTLYDRGYTSLGSRHNTKPNPSLCYKNQRGEVCYNPAYKLQEGEKERNGRL